MELFYISSMFSTQCAIHIHLQCILDFINLNVASTRTCRIPTILSDTGACVVILFKSRRCVWGIDFCIRSGQLYDAHKRMGTILSPTITQPVIGGTPCDLAPVFARSIKCKRHFGIKSVWVLSKRRRHDRSDRSPGQFEP